MILQKGRLQNYEQVLAEQNLERFKRNNLQLVDWTLGQLQNLAFKGWKDYSGLQFANYEQVWAKIGFTAFSNARAEQS